MTTLVLGTVGSLVGGAVGGSVGASLGWMLGSFLGNLIDPPKIEGPRRSDLKLQVSEYGKPIPRFWGLGRIAGNVIDQTDLIEHKQKSGGKGGPQVTTYTYSATFAIMLGVGPIVGVKRIWADGRLLWTDESGESMPCTLYLGTEDQDVDPTLEALHGVGTTPAYRGRVYCVFADYYLTDFGDRIPLLEFEIYTNGGDIPWRVNTFAPWATGSISNFNLSNGTTDGTTIFATEIENGGNAQLILRKWDFDGNQIGSTSYSPTYQNSQCAVYNSNVFLTWENTGFGGTYVYWWRYIPEEDQFRMVSTFFVANGASYYSERAFKCGDYIFCLGHQSTNTYIYRVPYNNGTPGEFDPAYSTFLWYDVPGNIQALASNDGTIYFLHGSHGNARLWHFDQDLNLLHFWDVSSTSGTNLHVSVLNGYVWNDIIVLATSEGTIGGGIGDYRIRLVKINSDDTLEDYGSNITHGNTLSNYIGNGLMMDSVGVYSLIPPAEAVTLAQIVSDLSALTDVGTVDVTELESDEVHWFAVANQMTVRNALDTLRQGFQFDGVESDDQAKFRKRGATDSVVTFDDDDLSAREYGTEQKESLRTIRKREKGLPRNVTLRYIDINTDYQPGVQLSPRITTFSDAETTVDLAIGFTATEAQQKVWKLQLSDWLERESFTWSAPREYAWLEPCDVVTVRGRVIRIERVTEAPNGVLEFEGVLHRASIYTQEQTGAPSLGWVDQTPSGSQVATQCVLLDIPILSQADSPFGFYAAMGPASSGKWTGATLYKSLDAGVNYVAVGATTSPAVIGATTSSDNSGSPQGSPTVSGALSAYGGGDVVDESSLCVRLTDPDAELESCTAAALENGANYIALSFGDPAGSPIQQTWELLQYRDAVLIAPQTYVLSGFKRGRKGTSTSGHAEGDTFVLLSSVINIDAPESELNHTYTYKGVTSGRTLAETSSQDFYNSGLGAEEYYNVEVGHLPVYGGNLSGSPLELGPGLVPPPDDPTNCRADHFLNECGDWVQGSAATGSPAAGGSIEVRDEGVVLTSAASVIDFTGSGVTASYSSGVVTVNVSGGGGGLGSPDPYAVITEPFVLYQASTKLPNALVLQGSPRVSVAQSGSPNALTVDLLTSGATAGSYGSTFSIPVITVDIYGRITSVSSAATVGTIFTLDEGASVDTDAIALNFTGGGITATDAGAGVTQIDVPLKAPTTARYIVNQANSDLPNALVLQAGTGVTLTEGGGSPPTTLTIAATGGSSATGGFSRSQEFIGAGTYTFNVPAGVNIVKVTMTGGGGGGGTRTSAFGGTGGGSGEYVVDLPVSLASIGSPSEVTVVVGDGGNGAPSGAQAAGSNGQSSSFGVFAVLGGKGGGTVAINTGGLGGGGRGGAGGSNTGAGSNGTAESPVHFGGSGGGGNTGTTAGAGGAGGPAGGVNTGAAGGSSVSTQGGGGGGGSSIWGVGGVGGSGGSAGNAGVNYGSGGGGAGGLTGSAAAGGKGAPGYVLVSWIGQSA